MKSCLVLCSGGVDSVTAAAWLRHEQWSVHLLCINYGQIMAKTERSAAERCARHLGLAQPIAVELPEVGLWGQGSIVERGSAGSNGEYFPHRNLFLIGTAAIVAASLGAEAVALGIITSETADYADCRPEFLKASKITLATLFPPLDLLTPFNAMTKIEVVKLALDLDVPLGLTFSCNCRSGRHCWECTGCLERQESFEALGVGL